MSQLDGFDGPGFIARPARRDETDEIQAFNEANADYWMLTHGHPPPPDDAAKAFDLHPPSEMTYSFDTWFIVRDSATRAIAGHVSCTVDLMSQGVVHLGFFLIGTERRGSGFAERVHEAYVRWATNAGARWLRLCVVEANHRGLRFWTRHGYREVKRVDGFKLGNLSHTLITMVQPLGSNTLDAYLAAVPRDRVSTTTA